MIYCNAAPDGRVDGDGAVIDLRAYGLDKHSIVSVTTLRLCPHSLMALHALTGDLILELMEPDVAEVTELRKHG